MHGGFGNMTVTVARIKLGLMGVAVLAALVPVPQAVSLGLLASVLLLTGLPHGAVDHLLHRHQFLGRVKRLNQHFYLTYSLWIAALAVFWGVWPQGALLLFLAVSAYHFGQTQAQDTQLPRWTYSLWGLWLVVALVASHPEALHWGFHQVLNVQGLQFAAADTWPLVLHTGGWVWLAMVLYGRFTWRRSLLEGLEMAALVLVFYRTDFYLSFAVFFGGWHAVRAIHNLLGQLRAFEPIGLRRFYREAAVHTLGSVLGIAGLVVLVEYVIGGPNTELLLFMGLSVVAVPHIATVELWDLYLRGRTKPDAAAASPVAA